MTEKCLSDTNRLDFTDSGSSVLLEWQSGDSFTVYKSTGEVVGNYNYTSLIGESSSVFSPEEGLEPNYTEGDAYYAVFPALDGVTTLEEHRAALSSALLSQTQTGAATYTNLGESFYMESHFTAEEVKNDVQFEICRPVIKIAFKAGDDTPPSKVVFNDAATEYTLEFSELEKTNLYYANIVINPSESSSSRELSVQIFSDDTVLYDSLWTSSVQYMAGVQYSVDFTQSLGAQYIYSSADLVAFRDDVNSGNSSSDAVLMADIYLTDSNWQPIGDSFTPYTGTFDGNGYKINGLKITEETTYRGLFGSISGATITGVTIAGAAVTPHNYSAILCGYASDNSLISNCGIEGGALITSSGSAIGGIVGALMSGSVVENCSNSADITGAYDIGGVAGFVDCSPVNVCYNSGEVFGYYNVGGVIGQLYSDYDGLVALYNAGNVYGGASSSTVGGIAGLAWSTDLTGCYNVGAVTGESLIGAIAGELYDGSELTDCYTVSGYNFGEGAILLSSIEELNSVVSKMNSSAGGDYFTQNSGNILPSILGESVEYESTPFVYNFTVSSAEELALVRELASKENAVLNITLTSDINLTGDWTPINNFYGTFSGDNHCIYNLNIANSQAKYQGLFGNVIYAEISNVRVIEPKIIAYSFAGGLVGSIDGGSVTNCSVEGGSITGYQNQVGGMFGSNGGTVVTYCFNSSTVTGAAAVGGLSGRSYSESDVIASYNIGDVTGSSRVGGLIGHCSGDTKGCYNAGDVVASSMVGGLIGYLYYDPVIAGNFNAGKVTADEEFGGIVSNDYPLTSCYYLSEEMIGEYGIMLTTLEELNGVVDDMNEAAGADYFTVSGDGYLPNLMGEQVSYQ